MISNERKLRIFQHRMTDAYTTYRMFHHASPRFPRGIDSEYAARFHREAKHWFKEVQLVRTHMRALGTRRRQLRDGGWVYAHHLSDLDGRAL